MIASAKGPVRAQASYGNITVLSLLKDVRAKFSNIDFFLNILPLKDDELAMSEM